MRARSVTAPTPSRSNPLGVPNAPLPPVVDFDAERSSFARVPPTRGAASAAAEDGAVGRDDARDEEPTEMITQSDVHADILRSQVQRTIPGSVAIRAADPPDPPDDVLDETEVRTLLNIVAPDGSMTPLVEVSAPSSAASLSAFESRVSAPGPASSAPGAMAAPETWPRLGRPLAEPPPSTAPRLTDASLAANAERAGVPESERDERALQIAVDEAPTLTGANEPRTLKAPQPKPLLTTDYDDESITTRGPAVDTDEDDESVATQVTPVGELAATRSAAVAAALKAGRIEIPADDGGDGSTITVKERREQRLSYQDAETESVTAKAPKALTNILRVIASEAAGAPPDVSGNEAPENCTAVMPDAPLKRILTEIASAPLLPTARRAQHSPSVATTAPMPAPRAMAGQNLDPSSASGLRLLPAAFGEAQRAPAAFVSPPTEAEIDAREIAAMRPRYGRMVICALLLAVAVPAAVFLVRSQRAEDVVRQGVRSERVPEIQGTDAPRTKADRSAKPTATASATGEAAAPENVSSGPNASLPRGRAGILFKR